MSKMVEKLAASGQLSPEQVERVGRNVSEFLRACKEDPEFAKEANVAMGANQGFMGTVRHALPQMAAGALVSAAGGAMLAAGSSAAGAIRDSIMRSRSYKAMMDGNPHLANHDAKEVQRAFGTLHKFNPQYASDPTVAGSFVQSALEGERFDIGALNNIVMARKNMAESNKQQRPDLSRFVQHQDPMAQAKAQWAEADRPYEAQMLRWKAMQQEHDMKEKGLL